MYCSVSRGRPKFIIVCMSGMSMPRAIISVATSMEFSPEVNLCRICSLDFWDLSLCMASADKLFCVIRLVSVSAIFLDRVNTIVFFGA